MTLTRQILDLERSLKDRPSESISKSPVLSCPEVDMFSDCQVEISVDEMV